ncbi:glutamate racemase [Leucobacter insecticola]|uniref:Glutamate racemase n=1 Tax=Leucobacter insecticola TaxID=2714934 RepID=A0A6G8FK37_9MICO|nr:glutamate racemase [Leucobacter insecticola]QIM16737.1 glutamate racemase [Leucobacter insecticola]
MRTAELSPEAPIGVFDSGVGGLTVARAIRDQLPNESMIYVGDTARTPYGPRPIAEVRQFALEILDDLVSQGVKMLVIACNTASAAVLRDARERYAVPVIEVIAPTVRSAASITRNRKVGLIGTTGTIQSRAYDDLFAVRPEITLSAVACPRFVELVEAGETSGPEVLAVAEEYLAPLVDQGVDTLVLGCTHYPFLRGAIAQVMGRGVALVSSDIETANEVYRTLTELDLLRTAPTEPELRYEATGTDTAEFVDLAQRMLGIGIETVDLLSTGAIQLPVYSVDTPGGSE